MDKAAKSLPIHQTLARELGVAILSGTHKPSDGLGGEIEQPEALGVSRTVYREALSILTAKGVIESAAAALAAARRDRNQLARMDAGLARMREHGLGTVEGQAADEEFHAGAARSDAQPGVDLADDVRRGGGSLDDSIQAGEAPVPARRNARTCRAARRSRGALARTRLSGDAGAAQARPRRHARSRNGGTRTMSKSMILALALATTAAPALGAQAATETFGKLADGTPVEAVSLSNGHGMKVRVLAWGAILQELVVPGKSGSADIVLGYDGMEGYLKAPNYFGASVGRYANRIARARFTLDGKTYQLAVNDGPNALHGGLKGFDKQLWTIAQVTSEKDAASVTLTYTSADGEEGYPGTLQVSATFTLTESNELHVTYRATSDKPTIVNLTNHSYFNLAGQASGISATEAVVTIPAQSYTPVDATLIPTGAFTPVAGTPFDFRTPRRVADRLRDGRDEQIRIARGYDQNWVVSRAAVAGLQTVAKTEDPGSGRVMEILSNQPGVQFYTGNFLDGTVTGKGGTIYRQGDGLCFEPQVFPDTPNKPEFGSARLDPGKTYENRIVYRFSVRR